MLDPVIGSVNVSSKLSFIGPVPDEDSNTTVKVKGGQHPIFPNCASRAMEPMFGRTAGTGPFDAAI